MLLEYKVRTLPWDSATNRRGAALPWHTLRTEGGGTFVDHSISHTSCYTFRRCDRWLNAEKGTEAELSSLSLKTLKAATPV